MLSLLLLLQIWTIDRVNFLKKIIFFLAIIVFQFFFSNLLWLVDILSKINSVFYNWNFFYLYKIIFFYNTNWLNLFNILIVFFCLLIFYKNLNKQHITIILYTLPLIFFYYAVYYNYSFILYDKIINIEHNTQNINNQLLNNIVVIHPILTNLLYSLFIYVYVLLQLNVSYTTLHKYICKKLILHNLLLLKFCLRISTTISYVVLILGGIWALQELVWGSWWNWDVIELIGSILFFFLIFKIHTVRYWNYMYIYNFIKSLIILTFYFVYLILRYDITNSLHSFNTVASLEQNIKLFGVFVFFVTYSAIFLFLITKDYLVYMSDKLITKFFWYSKKFKKKNIFFFKFFWITILINIFNLIFNFAFDINFLSDLIVLYKLNFTTIFVNLIILNFITFSKISLHYIIVIFFFFFFSIILYCLNFFFKHTKDNKLLVSIHFLFVCFISLFTFFIIYKDVAVTWNLLDSTLIFFKKKELIYYKAVFLKNLIINSLNSISLTFHFFFFSFFFFDHSWFLSESLFFQKWTEQFYNLYKLQHTNTNILIFYISNVFSQITLYNFFLYLILNFGCLFFFIWYLKSKKKFALKI